MPPRYEHASEDELEAYALGYLSEGELAPFEEHLLICPECQQRLSQTEAFIRALRAAAARIETEKDPKRAPLSWPEKLVLAILGLRWLWAAAALALALGIMLSWQAHRSDQAASPSLPFTITLQALRGESSAAGSHAPAGRPLLLEAETGGLAAESIARLKLVDSSGVELSEVPVQADGAKVRAYLPKGLEAGNYWVRLEGGAGGRSLLREYALKVE